MSKHKPEKIFKEIAQKSRLIKHINDIYNLSNHHEIQKYQGKINNLNLKYCLSSMEGRLELITDLISAGKNRLTDCEITALNAFTETLEETKDKDLTFLGFYIDNLLFTINQFSRNRPQTPDAGQQHSRFFFTSLSQTSKLLLALSLSGAMVSGCNQDPDSLQTNMAIAQTLTQDKTVSQAPTAPSPQPRNTKHAENFVYRVKQGDSIKSIASKFGTAYGKIVKDNKIRYDKKRDWFVIHPGMNLALHLTAQNRKQAEQFNRTAESSSRTIPLELSNTSANSSLILHLVEKGDCLWKISRKYNVPEKTITAFNNISNPDKIKYGNILKIPSDSKNSRHKTTYFKLLNREKKVEFLKKRTIKRGHPYLKTIVEMSEQYNIDSRLYAALIWEESWFDKNAKSKDNCRRLVQLDPRFHRVSSNMEENFRRSLGYLRHEFIYYQKNGFDTRSATICALAAYNGGNTRVRNFIKNGQWNGKNIEAMPLKETREHIKKVLRRCRINYQAVL